jgi:hypothetical protein
MLTDVHEAKINIPISINGAGDNVIVAGDAESWIYIHELIGDAEGAVTLTVVCGNDDVAEFTLSSGQGLTLDDVPGDDGVPRFKCMPGDDFIINLSSGVQFTGALQYSRRY